MKKTKVYIGMLALLCISFTNVTNAQQTQNADAVSKLKKLYDSYGPKYESTFEQFLKLNSQALANQPSAMYNGCDQLNTVCGNGDFENGLDITEWQGAYGTWKTGDPNPYSLTEGFISGPLGDYNAHQTIVNTDIDPNSLISTTNSNNPVSTQALRLGNSYNNYGVELISKTITVTSGKTIIPFYYALVFENPFDHTPEEQPAFSVRVFDCATGQELSGVCDLGNGSNKAISDRNNPFFKCSSVFGCDVVFRDWTRTEINLSAYIGKTVNIQFLNKDCGLGGHYGYTYLDDFGGCSTTITNPFYIFRNVSQTDSCGIGQICVDYVVPKDSATNLTGEVNINLDIYQNGSLVTTLNSDTLKSDSGTYCFNINPKTLGIDTSLDAFDYTLTGDFSINGITLSPQTIGNPPDGQMLGLNNDYYVTSCPNPPACDSTFKCVIGVRPKATVYDQAYHTIYRGYGPGSVVLAAIPVGGAGGYKFMWNDGRHNPVRVVAPNESTRYTVTVTDSKGCTTTNSVIIYVIDVRCGDDNQQVQMCYGKKTICVGRDSVEALLQKGAVLGNCNNTPFTYTDKTASKEPFAIANTLKVKSDAVSSTFTVYPNPARNTINFKWDAKTVSNAKLVITDLQGKILMSQTLANASQSIDISRLTNGVYIAQLRSSNQPVAISRFMVNR